MLKKVLVPLIVVILVAASVLVVHIRLGSKAPEEPDAEFTEALEADDDALLHQDRAEGAEGEGQNSAEGVEKDGKDEAEDRTEAVEIHEIKVLNNTPEYDFKAYLCKNNSNDTYLKFEFYRDGASVAGEFGSGQVPELESLSSLNAAGGLKDKGGIEAVYLSPKLEKAYFAVKTDAPSELSEMSIYSFRLRDLSLKKIFNGVGKFTDLFFTKNQKYLGFSYHNLPSSSSFQEDSLLEIINCENDTPVVTGSRNAKGQIIGGEKESDFIYNYSFIGWHSNTISKIKESLSPKGENKKAIKQRELLYDVEKNVFLNADGSPLDSPNSPKAEEKPEAPEGKEESEPVKALKSFYACLSSMEQYDKGMDLLDESFKLQLGILKQFGVDELSKKDIDAESVSMYANLLKMAVFESVVKEENKDDTATIYYYQLFSSSEGEQVRQPMVAQMRKVEGKWKITCIKDSDK